MNRYLLFFVLIPLLGICQTQIGQKIEGDTGTDAFGQSVAISADGTIIAVGAHRNDSNGSNAGHVRVYENISGTWTQIGNDIEGEAAGDGSGESVALSADGSVIAIGSPFNTNANGSNAGHVRVFENIAGTWTQIGNTIEGEAQWDRNGWRVALSADGTIVAMSARHHNGNGPESGQVRVFENVQGTWIQVGTPLVGLQPNHNFGTSVALSTDGNTVAIGTVPESTAIGSPGYTMIFENISGIWTQIGQPIYGTDPGNQSGRSISLSSDGNFVAVGEPGYATGGNSGIGNVRVFENVSGTWTQIGSRIVGEAAGDHCGISISLSADGTIIAIGAFDNDDNGQSSGHVRVYQNTSNTWLQVGMDIDGEEALDFFGGSVSLSANGDTLVVGATTMYTLTTKNGFAKVYDLSGVLSTDKFTKVNFTIYPNPATELLNIEFQDDIILENVTIYNNLGQKIKTAKQNTVDISTLSKGLYFVEVTTNRGKASKKVIVE